MNRRTIIATLMAWPFLALIAGLNLAHPFLHAFEGGGLDAFLDYLNAFAAQTVATLQPRRV